LAARWVANTGGAAPIEFERLFTLLDNEPEVLAQIHVLLEKKKNTPELGLAPAVPILNAFIENELNHSPIEIPQKSRAPKIVEQLNGLFHCVLQEQHSNKADGPITSPSSTPPA
jgi:predicted nucleotidyltransferase